MLLILANAILLYLVPDPCEKINTPNKQEIWKLDQVWHVSPLNLQKKFYCKEDKLEYFYIKQRDRSSLVAIQKVKITKESSCRNNALFSGKRKLFQGMIQSVKAANNHNPLRSEQTLLSKILSFNESTDHAGTYECRPLNTKNVRDADDIWEECECILYGFYPNGLTGLSQEEFPNNNN